MVSKNTNKSMNIKQSFLLSGEAMLCSSQLGGRHNHKINNFVKRTPFIVRHNAKNNIYVFEKRTQF